MKRYIAFFMLASVASIGFWFMPVQFRKNDAACDRITITGFITPETFLAARDCLVRSTARSKTFVVTESGGGNWESALALGVLIHQYGWNVEVVDLCASACANFIFSAGKVKYLNSESMLLFHGGPHQENLLDMAKEADKASVNQAPAAGLNSRGSKPNQSIRVKRRPRHHSRRRTLFEHLPEGTSAPDHPMRAICRPLRIILGAPEW